VTKLQVSVAELDRVLAETAFLQPYRFKVQSCTPGECVLEIAFQTEFERPGGIISGMTLMGAGDVGMWLAIMTLRGTKETWVTTDMKTAFLRSGRQEDVLCTAKVLKLGRRTAYGTAECNGASSGLLAHHVVSYAKIDSEAATR
jgi:acyl-coenzyme A thioesterase PaaI-like protein